MGATLSRRAIIVMLLLVAGCARPDWIESMLVTVDIAGTWDGTWTTGGGVLPVSLELQQSGQTVTGDVRVRAPTTGPAPPRGSWARSSGPVTGTLNGDFLRLSGRNTEFQLRVSGDEMKGPGYDVFGRRGDVELRRAK
jgi:hypothetical protein